MRAGGRAPADLQQRAAPGDEPGRPVRDRRRLPRRRAARACELCERFGKETYLAALPGAARPHLRGDADADPARDPGGAADRSRTTSTTTGSATGPFKMKLTIWREGDHAFFDWSGTDPQALGPINFYLSEGMFKMFIGIYLIMVNDPQILFNDGFYPLLHVVHAGGLPAAAALPGGARLPHARARAAVRRARRRALQERARAEHGGRVRHEPVHALLGLGRSKGEFFYSMEILYGGIPGRPIGDGMDGHSWWPLFENIPTEYLEAYYPMRIDGYTTVTDSGGAGLHRGGNGVEKRYVYLEPGEVSIHDDRWLTRPWGVLGGWPGARSSKLLAARRRHRSRCCRSKCDGVEVQPGDMLVYRRPAAAAGRTASTGRSRPSRATSRSGSSPPSSRRRATASSSATAACGDRGRARAAAEGARRRARVRLRPAARGARRPAARPRPASSRRKPAEAAALVAARAGRGGARQRVRENDGLPEPVEPREISRASASGQASDRSPPS